MCVESVLKRLDECKKTFFGFRKDDIRAIITDVISGYSEKLSESGNTIEALKKKNDALSQSVEKTIKKYNELSEKTSGSDADISILKKRCDELEAENDDLKKEIEKKKDYVSPEQVGSAASEFKTGGIKENNSEADSESLLADLKDALETEREMHKADNASFSGKIADLEKKSEELSEKEKLLQRKKDELLDKIEEYKNLILSTETLKSTIRTQNVTIESLKKKLSEEENRYSVLLNENKALSDRSERQKSEADDSRRTIQSLRNEVEKQEGYRRIIREELKKTIDEKMELLEENYDLKLKLETINAGDVSSEEDNNDTDADIFDM